MLLDNKYNLDHLINKLYDKNYQLKINENNKDDISSQEIEKLFSDASFMKNLSNCQNINQFKKILDAIPNDIFIKYVNDEFITNFIKANNDEEKIISTISILLILKDYTYSINKQNHIKINHIINNQFLLEKIRLNNSHLHYYLKTLHIDPAQKYIKYLIDNNFNIDSLLFLKDDVLIKTFNNESNNILNQEETTKVKKQFKQKILVDPLQSFGFIKNELLKKVITDKDIFNKYLNLNPLELNFIISHFEILPEEILNNKQFINTLSTSFDPVYYYSVKNKLKITEDSKLSNTNDLTLLEKKRISFEKKQIHNTNKQGINKDLLNIVNKLILISSQNNEDWINEKNIPYYLQTYINPICYNYTSQDITDKEFKKELVELALHLSKKYYKHIMFYRFFTINVQKHINVLLEANHLVETPKGIKVVFECANDEEKHIITELYNMSIDEYQIEPNLYSILEQTNTNKLLNLDNIESSKDNRDYNFEKSRA